MKTITQLLEDGASIDYISDNLDEILLNSGLNEKQVHEVTSLAYRMTKANEPSKRIELCEIIAYIVNLGKE